MPVTRLLSENGCLHIDPSKAFANIIYDIRYITYSFVSPLMATNGGSFATLPRRKDGTFLDKTVLVPLDTGPLVC